MPRALLNLLLLLNPPTRLPGFSPPSFRSSSLFSSSNRLRHACWRRAVHFFRRKRIYGSSSRQDSFSFAFGCRLLIALRGPTAVHLRRHLRHRARHRSRCAAPPDRRSARRPSVLAVGLDARCNQRRRRPLQFDAVPAGEYTILITKEGFRDFSGTLNVQSDSAPLLHFPLEVEGVNQRVEVNDTSQDVDTTSSASLSTLVRSEIDMTPGATRANSLDFITDYTPGAYLVHDQLHIRGGHQVSWLIDGVPVPNTNIAANVGPQFDPKDIDVVEIQRGGYSAE